MKGMITAPQPLAVDVGAKALSDGCNAIDAAVTAAFVQMVATPRSCGIGGFGMMNLHTGATGQEIVLDFHGKAGAKVQPDMWQDEMNCFNPTPGYANSIQPGRARVTGMAPTLVKIGAKPCFTVGAPGGTRIVTGILHALLNVLDQGMSATEAIAAPRFDCQGDVIVAHARIAPSVCEKVKAMGHDIQRLLSAYGGISSVHGIRIDPDTGRLDGGADPGDSGMALGV